MPALQHLTRAFHGTGDAVGRKVSTWGSLLPTPGSGQCSALLPAALPGGRLPATGNAVPRLLEGSEPDGALRVAPVRPPPCRRAALRRAQRRARSQHQSLPIPLPRHAGNCSPNTTLSDEPASSRSRRAPRARPRAQDSPLSNTVPAVKESSESCSALQAYRARAFRGGELQKESVCWHKKYSAHTQQHPSKKGPRTSTPLHGSKVTSLREERGRRQRRLKALRDEPPVFPALQIPVRAQLARPGPEPSAGAQAAWSEGSPGELPACDGGVQRGAGKAWGSLQGWNQVEGWHGAHWPRSLPQPSPSRHSRGHEQNFARQN